MRIEYKSTAMLLDEYYTTCLKYDATGNTEHLDRMQLLNEALSHRAISDDIVDLAAELAEVLRQCWNAQEISGRYRRYTDDVISALDPDTLLTIARAGLAAQRTNVERNKLIRDIDRRLGEGDRTPLDKTY